MREIIYSSLQLHILGCRIGQLHHLIRLNAHIVDGNTGGSVILGNGYLYRCAIISTINRLHTALTKGFDAEKLASLSVLDGPGHDFRSAGTAMVH